MQSDLEVVLARLEQLANDQRQAVADTSSAIRLLAERTEAQAEAIDRLSSRIAAIETFHPDEEDPLDLTSCALSLDSPEDQHITLCLDFGTARSKAFAASPDRLYDLAIGERAGAGGPKHSLLSCIFISDDKRIYFGESAAERSQEPVQRGARERINSIKEMITNSAPGSDLSQVECGTRVNPTAVPLTQGDLLTLYLAYLTDAAATELEQRFGVSRYVKRRFTTPVFPSRQQEWANEELRKHYCEATLVADHFSGRWQGGIDAAEARLAVRAARAISERVRFLTDQPLLEPIAAFASRTRGVHEQTQGRLLMTVIDAGAGTTDFATFAVSRRPDLPPAMFTVEGSVHVFKKSGNEVDRILSEYILDQVRGKHAGLSAEAMFRIQADLSLQQRRIKEDLFDTGRRKYELSDGTRGEVILADFEATAAVQSFASDLRIEFETALSGMHPSWIRECGGRELLVVATGGSAKLPMIQALTSLTLNINGVLTQCRAMARTPKWVLEDFSELTDQYPQLAVAIGGSQEELPTYSSKEYSAFKGMSDAGVWRIPPVLKGV